MAQHTYSNLNGRNAALTNEQLQLRAPSVFATQAYEKMSSKYAFIPTIQIVEKMRAEGFQPFSATQSRTRIEGKQHFTKHVIRFRDTRQGDAPVLRSLGSIYPELILTNAHDGGSAYKIEAGLFRLVCLNGLTVCDETISEMHVRHSGSVDGIIDASYQVVENFPKVLDSIEQFGALRLTAPQQNAYAEAAIQLRYDDEKPPVTAVQVLRPHRNDDAAPTLWNTFNVAQENLVGGGLRTRSENDRRARTRAVTGISENARLNKALWTLTQRMQELAKA